MVETPSSGPCGRTVLITTRPLIFFELKGAEVFCPRLRWLDDSGAAPRTCSERSAKGSSALRRHRGSGKTKKTPVKRGRGGGGEGRTERGIGRRRERWYILRGNVAVFPAIHGTDQFFWPSSHDSFIPRRMRSDRRSLPASSAKTLGRVILFGPLC